MNTLELYARFFMIWPGISKLGDPYRIQGIITFAFGRNSVGEDDRAEIGRQRRFSRSDAAALLKLHAQNIDVGEANRKLSYVTMAQMEGNEIPAAVQWENALAFPIEWYVKNQHRIFIIWPSHDPKQYLSAYDVATSAAGWLQSWEVESVSVIAQQRMVVRAALYLRRLEIEPIVYGTPVSIFDENSVQPWTASPLQWIPREIAARAYSVLHGWI